MSQVKTIHLNSKRNSRSRSTKADTPTRSPVSTERVEWTVTAETNAWWALNRIHFVFAAGVFLFERNNLAFRRHTNGVRERSRGRVRRLRNIAYNRWQLSRFVSAALSPISNFVFAEIEICLRWNRKRNCCRQRERNRVCVCFILVPIMNLHFKVWGTTKTVRRVNAFNDAEMNDTHTYNDEWQFTNSDYFYNNSGAIYTLVMMTPWAVGRNWVWNKLHNSSVQNMRLLLIANAKQIFIGFQSQIVLFAPDIPVSRMIDDDDRNSHRLVNE